jgi:hypothetical protein
VEAPGGSIEKRLIRIEPIFVPRGLWLCASYTPEQPTSFNTAAEPKARWKTYDDSAKDDVARLLVRGMFLADALDALGHKPEAERTATITGVGHEGKLIDGNTSIWLENDGEWAKLTIEPRANWTGDAGLRATCPYTAEAHADIAFNFRLPFGKVGSSIGCHGTSEAKGSGAPEAQFIPLLIDRASVAPATFKAAAFVITPVFVKGTELQVLRLHIETDGTFETKLPFGAWFKTDVPKVEVDAMLPVPPDILPRLPLLTNEPHPIDFGNSVKLPNGAVLIAPKGGFPTHAVLEPINGDVTPSGYAFEFKLTLETLAPDKVEARKSAISAMLRDTAKPTLTVGQIKVKVGGIGESNDLIKALIALGQAVGEAYEAGKKVAADTVETARKAAEDFAREGEKALADVSKEFSTAERNTERTIAKAGKDTEKALGKAAGQTMAAAHKAKTDFVNNVKKAMDWVPRNLPLPHIDVPHPHFNIPGVRRRIKL